MSNNNINSFDSTYPKKNYSNKKICQKLNVNDTFVQWHILILQNQQRR